MRNRLVDHHGLLKPSERRLGYLAAAVGRSARRPAMSQGARGHGPDRWTLERILGPLLVAGILGASLPPVVSAPPNMLYQQSDAARTEGRPVAAVGFSILRLPDNRFAFYDRFQPQSGPLTLPDREGTQHTLLPSLPERLAANPRLFASGVLNHAQVLAAGDLVTRIFVRGETLDRQTAAKVGLPRYLDLWMHQVSATGEVEPKMIWRGYNGSQMEYQQLPSGRILVPFGSFQPHGKMTPPTGRHQTIVLYSDDQGQTWTESPSKLTAPCYVGFNGNNEGACEPAIERLGDGRIWMLMRTQAGFLYESFSADDGTTWTPARASRFNTSTGPPNIMRHQNGWLVVCWNNCEMPPRVDGQGVYGGRDALHIAISDDDGETWRGFREIYLDHRRNDNPAKSGDRGTAYPLAAYTAEGRIVVIAGQGDGGRNPILVDPQWIVQTEARCDFSDGLSQWSVYKHHGPAANWWRARAVGCDLVPHPDDPADRCLHVRKPDELPADCATWNFPLGWSGSLEARVMVRRGSVGGTISLNDRMFDPSNVLGDRFAVFGFDFAAGADGDATAVLSADTWHDLKLQWDLTAGTCRVFVDGIERHELPLKEQTINGISYVRFCSAATERDPAGFLVDSVAVSIDDPCAPRIDRTEQQAHAERYVDQVVPTWQAAH